MGRLRIWQHHVVLLVMLLCEQLVAGAATQSLTATQLAPECVATWNASQPQGEYWSLVTTPGEQWVHWGATTTSPITGVADVFHGIMVIGHRLAPIPLQCGCSICPQWDLLVPIWNDNVTTVSVDLQVPPGWQPAAIYAQPVFFRHPWSSLAKYGNCGTLGMSVGKLWRVSLW